ncbi:MAG: lysophospholipid acyltransferase family protein [Prevotella sp.]|nr:lysophospholipid acyltransferase family protein [Bacteroides sp.]MCM1366209.1 lysophospholipid acyltransferase family protein [Prevotella sp.]MCM1436961.1 lysophospholipid acyltransferase family protein [Prevotella sp.]
MKTLGSWLCWGMIKAVSWIPLSLLYVVSDVVAFLMHTVVRYRRGVVRRNLESSFPHKSEEEISKITRKFYRFLSDYFVETLKLASMSESEMRRRLQVEGIDSVNAAVDEGKSVSLFLGHYCNWEWVSSLPLHIDSKAVCGQIYHPLESSVADAVFLRLRSQFGAVSVKMDDTLKTVSGWYRNGKPSVVGYISDQVPGYGSVHRWVQFLNHDTPVFTGAERISRMVHAQCYYVHLSRPRRGMYKLRFVPLAADASREEKFVVTDKFFGELERQIDAVPEYWLWSHRRWKRTRERFLEIYGEEEAAKRLSRL